MTLAWLLLFLCLSLTLRIWVLAKNYSEQNIQTIFSLYTRQVQSLFQERFKGYEELLRGTAGLADAQNNISPLTWDTYLKNTGILKTYPELELLGFAQEQANGNAPLTLITPNTDQTNTLLGKNLFSLYQGSTPEFNIHHQHMIISQFQKLDPPAFPEQGFFLILPVFPKGTEIDHLGFVFAWLKTELLFKDITHSDVTGVALRILENDGKNASKPTSIVFQSTHLPTQNEGMNIYSLLNVANRVWTLEFRALPELQNQSTVVNALIWVTGILFSFAIFGINKTIVDYNRIMALERAQEDMLANESKLRYEASHDILTGLPNRYGLENRFLQAIRYADEDQRQVAIAFLDLDDFKKINDTFGHEYGDESMKILANRIESCIRNIDTVARIGGDEFLILLSNQKDQIEINHLIHRILDQLHQPMNFKGQSVQVSCSIGISIYPQHGDNLEELLNKADRAMYSAKAKGKNNFFYYSANLNT